MTKYKFLHEGAIYLRGREPIFPESLTDEQVEKLLDDVPSLSVQFEKLDSKPDKVKADKKAE